MSTIKVKRKHSGFKGSVLFTVLTVMMVMLILVLTTITLAGIASKKAYSTWFDNQTTYTAQSLVDNVVTSFQPPVIDPLHPTPISPAKQEQMDMGAAILNQIQHKGDEVTIDVTVDQGGVPTSNIPGYGTVQQLTFTNVGSTTDFNFGTAMPTVQQIIKVTAVVNMGDEESTYSTYVTGSNTRGTGRSSPGGFIAKGQNFGGSGSNDAPSTYGRVYVGINGPTEVPAFESTFANQSSSAGDLYYNVTKLTVNASTSGPLLYFGRNDPQTACYSGLKVSGQLIFSGGNVIKSKYSPVAPDMSQDCVNNFPYINAKEIVLDGDGAKITIEDGPMNIFCGSITNNTTTVGSRLGGSYNLVCLDEGADNVVPYDGSSLTRWVSTLAAGDPKYDKTQTGNVYCKGNFKTKGNGGTIDGDLLVLGNLEFTNNMTVNGSVFYGGTITGADKLTCSTPATKITATDFDNFCTQCDGIKSGAGSRFKDIVNPYKKINGSTSPVEMFQTFQHLKESYFESDGTTYKGTYDRSSLVETDANDWHGENVIDTVSNKYYRWGYDAASLTSLADSSFKRIDINPGNTDMWINISNDVSLISDKLIVVDDSAGGSVRFFIQNPDDMSANWEINLNNTYIVTRTYLNMLLDASATSVSAKSGAALTVQTYPTTDMVPKIFIYSGTGNKVKVHMTNNGLITGDLVGPDGTFESDANCNVKVDTSYTLQTYDTVNNVLNPNNQFTINENQKPVRVIGSIEFDHQDNTNGFGYLYVDDPPTSGGPAPSTGAYAWSMQDGFSTY